MTKRATDAIAGTKESKMFRSLEEANMWIKLTLFAPNYTGKGLFLRFNPSLSLLESYFPTSLFSFPCILRCSSLENSIIIVLFRCYKCIDVDYNLDYKNNEGALAELAYTAVFIGDQVSERSINCEFNGKTSSENLCRCDVDFAESIAQLRSECVRK